MNKHTETLRVADLEALAAEEYAYLTTRGRRSGQPHEIEIWFALDGTTLYLLAGAGTASDWVRNLQADSAVTVRLGDATYPAHARVVDPNTDDDERARTLVHDKFAPRGHGDLIEWRARALPVALEITTPWLFWRH